MAKKTDTTTKPTALNGATPAPAPVTPAPVTPAPATRAPVAPALVARVSTKRIIEPAAKVKPVAKKAKTPPPKAKGTTKKAAPKKATYTREDVALRAYFISEKRRAHGLPGDERHDWIEAERQILAEGGKPKKAKKA